MSARPSRPPIRSLVLAGTAVFLLALGAAPGRPVAPVNVDIAVTDLNGAAVPKIAVQRAIAADPRGRFVEPIPNCAEPYPGSHVRTLTNASGLYNVPNGSFIDAASVGRALVSIKAGQAISEPLPVVLTMPASLTLQVVDKDGKPVPDLAVIPQEFLSRHAATYPFSVRTDRHGKVRFDSLSSGEHSYVVLKWDAFKDSWPLENDARYCAKTIYLNSGEDATHVMTYGFTPPDHADVLLESLMDKLRRARIPQWDDLQALDAATAKDVAKAARNRLIAKPKSKFQISGEKERLIHIIAYLRDVDSLDSLKTLLLLADESEDSACYGNWVYEAFMAIADMSGDECVPFLENLIRRDFAPRKVRGCAIIMLGRLGTEQSVATFVRLRDAAFAKETAPVPKERYTHAEKMIESTIMTLHVIPDDREYFPRVFPGSVIVDVDYNSGQLTIDGQCGPFMSWRMRRFGSEWLISEIAYPTEVYIGGS